MSFWETITGSDLTREWKVLEARAEGLSADYQPAWEQIKGHLFPYAGFTRRDLRPILDAALGLKEADVRIQDIIEGKKQWRAHVARVRALPPDYQIVYKEMQRYLFKVGPIDLSDGRLLPGIVDFFAEGAAAGKGVLELIGNDVAAFCEDLVDDSGTSADVFQESLCGKPGSRQAVRESGPPP